MSQNLPGEAANGAQKNDGSQIKIVKQTPQKQRVEDESKSNATPTSPSAKAVSILVYYKSSREYN